MMFMYFVDCYNQVWLFVVCVYCNQVFSGLLLFYLVYLGMVVNELLVVDCDGVIEWFGEILQIVVLYDILEDMVILFEELW